MTVTEELSDTGLRPRWAAESFPEPETDVKQSIARVEADPFLLHTTTVRGFVYDVSSGELREVTRD
ncbi:carbonic anhydrase [Dietzia aurantiaca]|uniref:carbonic anhydrase n=1 Tax=Dietzia aurantiaca TaxID=983873 RepID=UPI001E30C3D9|nr:carbonic anhydrase [Dietzia aurantiaca]MCD2262229.1 carbonic anhydrase [Dietzia aurantiaca]